MEVNVELVKLITNSAGSKFLKNKIELLFKIVSWSIDNTRVFSVLQRRFQFPIVSVPRRGVSTDVFERFLHLQTFLYKIGKRKVV